MAMIKKIAAMFKKPKSQNARPLDFEKKPIDAKEATMDVFEEYAQRLPGFPLGIPVIPVELLIEKNMDMIKQIILARGLAGAHNQAEVEKKIMSPIRHLAEMTHLLPASEKNHFKLIGGLFAFCLELSLFSIRYAERRILTRSTPEIRKEEESLWAHAAFLNGLYCEAITALSKLSVYAEDIGIEWRPSGELLSKWLIDHQLERYHIRWSEEEERSTIYILMGKAIQKEQADILATGEKAIFKTLYAALQDQRDQSNPLSMIFATVKYKIMERDEWSHADRYGKPLAGMHLEPWLIDAMRHLVQKKRWSPNDENGRIWHGRDGVFLVWPLAAGDMQHELKTNECPFIPNTNEVLADILLEAGIVCRNRLGGYVYDISVPVVDSADRKSLESLKIARPEILFVKTHHKPINEELCIHEHEEAIDENEKAIIEELEWQAVKNELEDLKKSDHSSDRHDELPTGKGVDAEENTNVIFLGKDKTFDKKPIQVSPQEIEVEFDGGSEAYTSNQYDDEYAADYQAVVDRDIKNIGDSYFEEDGEKVAFNRNAFAEKQREPKNKETSSASSRVKKPLAKKEANVATDEKTESLIGLLISSSKSEPEGIKHTQKKHQPDLSSKQSNNKPNQVDWVLKQLKNLPAEHVSVLPDGMTKVMVKGVKETRLKLNDCVSVLKSAGLIELVDGHETGLSKTGNGTSRYFLIRANLFDGK